MQILIVAKRGVLQSGLQTIATAFSPYLQAEVLDDSLLAKKAIKQNTYQLIFMDSHISFDEMLEIFSTNRAKSSPAACVLVVETKQQIQPALSAGATEVIQSGFSAEKIFQILQRYSPVQAEIPAQFGINDRDHNYSAMRGD